MMSNSNLPNSDRYEVQSFRCHSIAEALDMISQELGNEAHLMYARLINRNLLQRLFNSPSIEVIGGVKSINREDNRSRENHVHPK